MAYFIVSVDISELPLVTGDTHPLKLCPQVNELPPFFPLLVILFGVVGESVELLIRNWTEREMRKKTCCYIYSISTNKIVDANLAVEDAGASCRRRDSLFLSAPQSSPPGSSDTG